MTQFWHAGFKGAWRLERERGSDVLSSASCTNNDFWNWKMVFQDDRWFYLSKVNGLVQEGHD